MDYFTQNPFHHNCGTKKIAAYCRVSTDKTDQTNSFESQQRYFKQYIDRMPNWELYEIFADEGITGTNTTKRKAFNRMIERALQHEFDFIITKEISRFARNTLDSIYYTRELKKHGVGVLFLNDNINTLDTDAELRLSIMSSIAQEESRKTSERVKWGQKRRMEQGVVFGRDLLGYDVHNGELKINTKGAEIVRLIFYKFVQENKGSHVIARELTNAGIKTYRNKIHWSNSAILRIIRNEKYCGDLIQKKTYTPDYLSHEKKYNLGQEELVIIRNHHSPIISRKLFEQANTILHSRSLTQKGKAKYSNRYCFSGKIKCPYCEANYVARNKKLKDKKIQYWRCYRAVKKEADSVCKSKSIRNEDALQLMKSTIENLKINKTQLEINLIRLITKTLSCENSFQEEKTAIEIMAQKKRLIQLYINGDMDQEDYDKQKDILQKKQKDYYIENQKPQILINKIRDRIQSLLQGNEDEVFYNNILEKMIVYSPFYIDVYLKHLPYKLSYSAN